MSSRPNRSTASADRRTAPSGSCGHVTLLGHRHATGASTSDTVSLARSRSMSAQTTRAPSSAKRRAEARPTPEPPPVMTAVFPFSIMHVTFLVSSGSKDQGTGRAGLHGNLNALGSGHRLSRHDLRLGLLVVSEGARGVDDAHPTAHTHLSVDGYRRSRGVRQASAGTGGSAGVNRYSFSALPRRILY